MLIDDIILILMGTFILKNTNSNTTSTHFDSDT